jgi:hypothetical protein
MESYEYDIIRYESFINLYNFLPEEKKILLSDRYKFWCNEIIRLKKITEEKKPFIERI